MRFARALFITLRYFTRRREIPDLNRASSTIRDVPRSDRRTSDRRDIPLEASEERRPRSRETTRVSVSAKGISVAKGNGTGTTRLGIFPQRRISM